MRASTRHVETAITGCILARNEQSRIADALDSLATWTDEIIVIDNESDDNTVGIAKRYTDVILSAPRALNFDAARNLAADCAIGGWLFYLDADERVPARLGPILRQLVHERGDQFDALQVPFKHYFCGKWMEHSGWWPGYTRPQLLKKGRFRYNERLHSGVHVDGRTATFPADDPELAIVHYSYDDLGHYLDKLNRYTDGEAVSLREDGQAHTWQAALAHLVLDWQQYYDRGRADLDGMHGFVLSFLSGMYRFLARAKLWDIRRAADQASVSETVPASVAEMLAFMEHVAKDGPGAWLAPSLLQALSGGPRVPQEWLEPNGKTSPAAVASPHEANRQEPRRSRAKRTSGPSGPAGKVAGITACIVARNEERRIAAALQSVVSWADRVVVVDNESDDRTAEIARTFTPHVLSAQPASCFEEVRLNALPEIDRLAAEVGDWLLFIDADERIPALLGEAIRKLISERGEEFDALCLPFRNHFYGKWMQSGAWWPGYKGPQVLRRGRFAVTADIHSGAQVHGKTLYFPTHDPDLAVAHIAYDSVSHYLGKLNSYTDAQSAGFDGSHCWQAMLATFVHDLRVHYDDGGASRDGMNGFVQSILCAFYSFVIRAKAWDRRQRQGEVDAREPVPGTLAEMLGFMRSVLERGSDPWLRYRYVPYLGAANTAGDNVQRVPLLWSGPLLDPSGYAEDGRNLVLGLRAHNEPVVVAPIAWSSADAGLSAGDRRELQRISVPPQVPSEICVSNTLPRLLRPSETALVNVARTVFETDRLADEWQHILNEFDRIWLPSEYCRDLFVRSGVKPDRIAVIPEAVGPEFLHVTEGNSPLPWNYSFTFLSVFDWMLHKGWDVLLEAFVRALGGRTDVGLVIKTWSSNGYTTDRIREQADTLLRARCGIRLADVPNLHIWEETLPASSMPSLYRAADCFVLPTRGEGWCRPLMEAMAVGLPTIATAWSGLTTYHSGETGYPLDYSVRPVSPAAGREVPFYAGHNWAEPDVEHLQRLLRRMIRYRAAARKRGQNGASLVRQRFSRDAVASVLMEEIETCRALVSARPKVFAAASRPPDSTRDVGSAPSAAPPPVPRLPPANPTPVDPVTEVSFLDALGRPLRVRWEGDQAIRSSLALVNRETCLALLEAGDVELSVSWTDHPWHNLSSRDDPRFGPLLARAGVELSGPPDVTVRHHYPPNWERTDSGKLVIMQP
jgi:glycosyltransferase involved in cell wall biosynthesis